MKNYLYGLVATLAATCSGQAMAATIIDFGYTGAAQQFLVPVGVNNIFVEIWGAQGYSAGARSGGLGGFTSGNLAVTGGQTLLLYVGGAGTRAATNRVAAGGGFNGGGDGMTNSTGSSVAGGGGGATDVRLSDSLADRQIVAGGGGGATANSNAYGGAGGGAVGGSAGNYPGNMYLGGQGGTQWAGGSAGAGLGEGADATASSTPWIGGGGGGWYGGGVAAAHMGGGGGSSFIGGVADGVMTQGVRAGDGAARFTFDVAAVPEPATWAMMFVGFGMIGAGVRHRRRKQSVRVTYA